MLTTAIVSKVFVQDFVPRLNVDASLQKLMRQEFHRVAASMSKQGKLVFSVNVMHTSLYLFAQTDK